MVAIQVITPELLAGGCTTTVSNTSGAWAVAHAPTNPAYRQELDRVAALPYGTRNDALCGAQLKFSIMYQTVEPVWCIRGYWYLRNLMNLGSTWPAGRETYATIWEAVEAGVRWAQQKPDTREVVVRTDDWQRQIDHHINNVWTLEEYVDFINRDSQGFALAGADHWRSVYGFTTAAELGALLDAECERNLEKDRRYSD